MRRETKKRLARLATAGVVVLGLAAPALADHFDWEAWLAGDPRPDLTAEDIHCPEGVEEEECVEVFNEVANELADSEHPENHGKYVSFVAHCIPGGPGKGQKMRQIAQASEDDQMDMAVKLCAESKLEASESETEDVEAEETEVEDESEEDEGHGKGKGKDKDKGKGKGRPAGVGR